MISVQIKVAAIILTVVAIGCVMFLLLAESYFNHAELNQLIEGCKQVGGTVDLTIEASVTGDYVFSCK